MPTHTCREVVVSLYAPGIPPPPKLKMNVSIKANFELYSLVIYLLTTESSALTATMTARMNIILIIAWTVITAQQLNTAQATRIIPQPLPVVTEPTTVEEQLSIDVEAEVIDLEEFNATYVLSMFTCNVSFIMYGR